MGQRTPDQIPGGGFGCHHRRRQGGGEGLGGVPTLPLQLQRGADLDGGAVPQAGQSLAIGDAHGQHPHIHPLASGQLGQPPQPLVQPQRFVVAVDAPFRKDHQLLAPLQQIHRQPQARQGGAALVDSKAAQPLQQPTLQPLHLIAGDHEAAIAAGDAASCRIGQQQRVPAGPVGGGQQHRPLLGKVLPTPHLYPPEETRQGQILGDQHRQG